MPAIDCSFAALLAQKTAEGETSLKLSWKAKVHHKYIPGILYIPGIYARVHYVYQGICYLMGCSFVVLLVQKAAEGENSHWMEKKLFPYDRL